VANMKATKVYHDADIDSSVLDGGKIAIIGYGNQGRSHALNLRDSGFKVIVGNIKDSYWDQALKDGFEVYPIDKAVELSDIIYILLPDEMQPNVYRQMIEGKLKPGKTLVFASGFNIHFKWISVPEHVDVVMEAPRMLGFGVREHYLDKSGFPTLIAVHQDASGNAHKTVLALAKAIGATKMGAFESSFEEEAVLDCFSEQGCYAGMYALIQKHFEIAVEAGYSPEIVVLELWKSGELLDEIRAWMKDGIFRQIKYHSHTSGYGSLTRGPRLVGSETEKQLRTTLYELQHGYFARELMMEFLTGETVFNKLVQEALSHPINEVEERVTKQLQAESTSR